MICPNCNGTGRGGPAFVHRTTGCRLEESTRCHVCGGSKEVHDEYPEWLRLGHAMMQDRIGRGVSLREEADRRGLRPVELSGMEHGRIKPESTPIISAGAQTLPESCPNCTHLTEALKTATEALEKDLNALKGAYKLPRPWLVYSKGAMTFIEWETAVAAIDLAIKGTESILKSIKESGVGR